MKRKTRASWWFSLVACVFCTLSSFAQTKIVVLSDTHVMSPDLLVRDGKAWRNFLKNDRKLVDESRELFDVMIDRMKNEIKPDLVFITGDLTKDGETQSHQYVVKKLDELREAGIQTLVIPGNHDRGENVRAVCFDGNSTIPTATISDSTFEKIYTHYGYGHSSLRANGSLTYACEPIKGLWVIGIDSGRDGKVDAETLDWVCNQASVAKNAGDKVVVLMHHPLVPHFYQSEKSIATSVVDDYENVRNRLSDVGVNVVFTGHFHTSDIAKAYNADLSRAIYDVTTGSLISYPCDYREVLLSNDLSEMKITTHRITQLPHDAHFSKIAKRRLSKAMKGMATQRGYGVVKGKMAKAYVLHAEGDEHQSKKAQKLLRSLHRLASLARTFKVFSTSSLANLEKMAVSMLQDINAYGEKGRENQVDDLNLTIRLDE